MLRNALDFPKADWVTNLVKNFSLRNSFFDDKKTDQLNLRQWMVRRGIFSKEVLSLLVLSNVVSVVLGVGIGYTALIRSFRG